MSSNRKIAIITGGSEGQYRGELPITVEYQ